MASSSKQYTGNIKKVSQSIEQLRTKGNNIFSDRHQICFQLDELELPA
jgi:hypothetical protein